MSESFKSFSEGPMLSSREAAEALGVSESSVKRWCDGGRLRTVRTPGGHRRIPGEALLELSRRGGPWLRRPSLVVERSASSPASHAAARRDLVRALLEDDAASTRDVLEAQRRASSSLDVVADEVIAPAMAELGERWAKGKLEIYEERRACGVLHAWLNALGDVLPPPRRGAPEALGGTLEGDPYTLPTALAEIVLRERGFAARSLGSWLPAESLARAIEDRQPRVVWLSVGHVGTQFRSDYAKVERAARAAGAALVVGGRALGAEERRGLRYSAFCDGMVPLASFAEALT